ELPGDPANVQEAIDALAARPTGSLYGIVSEPVENILEVWQSDDEAARPKGRRTAIIDDLVENLIDAGVWDKLDFLYLFGQPVARNALYDFSNPSRTIALAES